MKKPSKFGPEKLGPEGRKLFTWLQENFDGVERAAPLALKLCQLSDRLEKLGECLKGELSATDRVQLQGMELRAFGSFQRLWKLLIPPIPSGPEKYANPGRPAEFDRFLRKGA